MRVRVGEEMHRAPLTRQVDARQHAWSMSPARRCAPGTRRHRAEVARRAHPRHRLGQRLQPAPELGRLAAIEIAEVERASHEHDGRLQLPQARAGSGRLRGEGGGGVAITGLVVVLGDALGVLEAAVSEGAGVGRRGAGVQVAPGCGGDGVEHDLRVHRRGEAGLRGADGPQEIAGGQRGHGAIHLGHALPEHGRYHLQRHRVAEHRRGLQRGALHGAETADARSDEGAQGARHGGGALQARLHRPALATTLPESSSSRTSSSRRAGCPRRAPGEGEQLRRQHPRADALAEQGALSASPRSPMGTAWCRGGWRARRAAHARGEEEDRAQAGAGALHSPIDATEHRLERGAVHGLGVVPGEEVEAIVAQALHHAHEGGAQRAAVARWRAVALVRA